MTECLAYISSPTPDKMLATTPVSSVEHPIHLYWMIPTSFITTNPTINLCWVNLNEVPVELEWVLKYQYLNEESYLGYFDDEGMPTITFDDGLSEKYAATLKANSPAEKDIIQITPPHNFSKRDRRSGTMVAIEIRPNPSLENVYFMGAEIKFTEHPRVREPTGRKRTYKKKWYDYE